jgi:molybdate transport system substrate-binding protein
VTRAGLSRLLFLLLAGALVACSGGQATTSLVPTSSTSAAGATLTVFAAASLKSVLDSINAVYVHVHPEIELTVSTDSSAGLETQIEQGAPADLFLSADAASPQKLADAGLAAGAPVVFAGNQLVIIVPPGNPADITSPMDLARPGVRIVAAGDSVPITKYASQLVANLAGEADDPPGFAAAYAANVVTKQDNDGAVVTQIQVGQGDAAIVYATDARSASNVVTVNLPADVNVVASDAGVVVKTSSKQVAAKAFLDWLRSDEGQAVLARFGFLPPAAT